MSMDGEGMVGRVAHSGGEQGEPEGPVTRRERGQTLVVAAMMMVGLMAFLAVVIDVGNIYTQRRIMQNAADAAALAGARLLALNRDSASVDAAMRQYARANGAQTCATSVLTQSVVVTASETFSTYFASIVGVRDFSVWASAAAQYGFPRAFTGLAPIMVREDVCVPSADPDGVEIWDTDKVVTGEGVASDGQRGWANFDGGASSETELDEWIQYGYPGSVNVNDWIEGSPGTKTSAMQTLARCRLNQIIFVPVYSETITISVDKLQYHVTGFAAFSVTQIVDTGYPKFVKGKFMKYVSAAEMGGTIDTGVRVIGLTR